jgi:hypothetical protein
VLVTDFLNAVIAQYVTQHAVEKDNLKAQVEECEYSLITHAFSFKPFYQYLSLIKKSKLMQPIVRLLIRSHYIVHGSTFFL